MAKMSFIFYSCYNVNGQGMSQSFFFSAALPLAAALMSAFCHNNNNNDNKKFYPCNKHQAFLKISKYIVVILI